jgi:alpha-galactosidase
MLGGDIRSMKDELIRLVTNRDLLRIDQDEEARPAFIASELSWFPGRIVLAKHLTGNEIAVGFFNMTETGGQVPFFLENIGLTAASGRALQMREVFTGEERTVKEFMNPVVAAHDCSVYLCRIVKG